MRFFGLLTDPVSKRRFRPDPGSPTSTDDETGVQYLCESQASQDMFQADPVNYRLPGYEM